MEPIIFPRVAERMSKEHLKFFMFAPHAKVINKFIKGDSCFPICPSKCTTLWCVIRLDLHCVRKDSRRRIE